MIFHKHRSHLPFANMRKEPLRHFILESLDVNLGKIHLRNLRLLKNSLERHEPNFLGSCGRVVSGYDTRQSCIHRRVTHQLARLTVGAAHSVRVDARPGYLVDPEVDFYQVATSALWLNGDNQT